MSFDELPGDCMSDIAWAIILGFTILSVKHTVADYFLQTPYQVFNKGIYGHPGGLLHSGIHVALTVPVFLVLPPPSLLFAVMILVGEYLVHYHVDWLKEQVNKSRGWNPNVPAFWRSFGVDQLAHTLTYITIVYLLAR